jgi:hypothetical protein
MRVFRRSQSVSIENPPREGSTVEGTSADGSSHKDATSILVAVGGRAHNCDALDWAASEAAARDCPLRIVHAFRWDPGPMNSDCAMPMDGCDAEAMEAATKVLQEARSRAATLLPAARVSAYIEEGSATTAILRHEDRETLVVLPMNTKNGSRFLLISASRRIRPMAAVLSPSSSWPHRCSPGGTWVVYSSFLKAPCIRYQLCFSRFGRRSEETWASPCYAPGYHAELPPMCRSALKHFRCASNFSQMWNFVSVSWPARSPWPAKRNLLHSSLLELALGADSPLRQQVGTRCVRRAGRSS